MGITDIDHLQIAVPKGCEAQASHFFGELHIGVEEPFQPATKDHPAFSVTDIDSVFKLLEQEGVCCVWDEANERCPTFLRQ